MIKLSGDEIQGCSSCNLCGPVYKLLIFMEKSLPPIPAKRYFTIGEVSELCGVKPHVLRYWEQEFTQLRPMKRRGNRRYYQRHEVLMIRRIRDLLYDQGFTITGARNKLQELVQHERDRGRVGQLRLRRHAVRRRRPAVRDSPRCRQGGGFPRSERTARANWWQAETRCAIPAAICPRSVRPSPRRG